MVPESAMEVAPDDVSEGVGPDVTVRARPDETVGVGPSLERAAEEEVMVEDVSVVLRVEEDLFAATKPSRTLDNAPRSAVFILKREH